MLPRRILSMCFKNRQNVLVNTKKWCSSSENPIDLEKISGDLSLKYKEFKDEDAEIIFDVEEERKKITDEIGDKGLNKINEFEGINLQRGTKGVYDIEELVDLLKRDRAEDIFVCKVDPAIKYVNYICIATGKSHRHILALAEFVRKVYKRKRNECDVIPAIEGKSTGNWMALDLGNIALHIFDKKTRMHYDLETLWSVGEKYDNLCNSPDDLITHLLQGNSLFYDSSIQEKNKNAYN